MVQIPTTSGAAAIAAAAIRDSPASGHNGNNNGASSGGKPQFAVNGNGAPQIPAPTYLSAMHSPALDLSSVERRGQPTASRETAKRLRPHGLQEAPTYRPTEEEFKDPYEYIKKIAPEASKYGICKIIPPDSYKPDFAINTEKFHFKSRKQELNSVEGSNRANLSYLDRLVSFHKQSGTNLNRFPSVDKRPLDLYKLKKAVESRGGLDKVCKLKKWAEIGRDLGYSGKIMSSLSTSLKNSYSKWLQPYEDYLRGVKPGVQRQLEYEYGGPFTPSPANSPMKKLAQDTPSGLRDDSPVIRSSEALHTQVRESTELKHIPILEPSSQPQAVPAPATSGFTAVNAGGFTAVNSAPTQFVPVNISSHRREREPEMRYTPPRRTIDSPLSSAKHTPEYRSGPPSGPPLPLSYPPNPLKRQLSHDSNDSRKENDNPDSEGGGRRSKRLKKEVVPTVANSNMTLLKPTFPRTPGEHNSTPGERCAQCSKTEDLEHLLTCESCDLGYHMYCLDSPVTSKPDHDWYCPRCLVGDGQYGFEEGGTYSLKQFQEKAADFKEGYFQNRLPFDPVLNCPRPVTEDDIEREFWRLVVDLEEMVTVEYGADIHSTIHGSGFPTSEKNPRDPYSTDPWNLNIMPLHADSLFRHIKSDISGMTVPWLYVGMIFSTFCWHNEDHYSYSANYQHFGSTKTWYGIPAADADNFEAAMRDAVPELFETQPDLLFQLVTLLTPEQLKKAGVRVYALDQRAGQFVITFPQAYHAGFNHGFNFNEAVNFAPADWEPFGDAGVERLQQFRRQPCFSHDELLWTAAEGAATGGVTIQTAKWLSPALDRMRTRESEQRRVFLEKHKENDHPPTCIVTDDVEDAGPRCHVGFTMDENDVPEEEYQCTFCKAYAYLSRFKCEKTGKIMCLLHAGNYECCEIPEDLRYSGKDHTLHYRRTEEAIVAIHQKVADKAQLPEVWEEKYAKALEESETPQLKMLRALLNEGERIPYELPSLAHLKAYVEKCNEWVEEATSYITRKQQNRRKSEKAWRKGSKTADMEEREKELRKVENVLKLIKTADRLGFDCPEITQLRERAESITDFQRDAQAALANPHIRTTSDFEDLLELGRTFNVDMPELEKLDVIVQQKKWNDKAREARGSFLSLSDVIELIDEGEKLSIPSFNDFLRHFKEQRDAGEAWEAKAKELMAVECVHYPQLEALSNQAQAAALPVSADTLAAVDQILNKQREAHRQIISLYDRCKDPEVTNRPKYSEVRDTMEALAELNSKPNGTLDLEKEQKRHEDWMRKGKKLFGKANAPLHILKSHMEYVLERNYDCFDIVTDKPRSPAEPSSREHSPVDGKMHSWEDPRFREVFCICRKIEAGMMIECELCHEWYHGKCLKIARGKVKEEEKYTCPICDWRVKIPRDAARPKLEDLLQWQDEIQQLPFQPEEEEVLDKIINNAQEFRLHVAPYCNPIMATSEEAETQRFFLRKIEGAEILLAYETNYFRQELHKWSPVAPEAPPVLENSKSTRKPRPTKLQKLMAQHGVDDPEALPQNLRTKQINFKRKSSEPLTSRPQPLQPAPGRSDSGTPTSHSFPISGPGQQQGHHHGPVLSGSQNDSGPPMMFDSRHQYGMSGPGQNHSPQAPFTSPYLHSQNPHSVMGGGHPSQQYGTSASNRDPAIFTGAAMSSIDPALGGSGNIDSPMRDSYGRAPNGGNTQGMGSRVSSSHGMSSQGHAMDNMFNDLTHQDEDSQDRMRDRGVGHMGMGGLGHGQTERREQKSYTQATLEGLGAGAAKIEPSLGGGAVEDESEFLREVGAGYGSWGHDSD